MANAFVKAQFMEPPSSGVDGAVPIGAVKAGPGITISSNGIISLDGGSGIINEIICTNGIVGGGSSPQVIIALAPPTATTIGGVKTAPGSNISIDSNGVIRSTSTFTLTAGLGAIINQTSPESAQVSVRPAGSADPATLGGVYITGGSNGLGVETDGRLSLLAASANRLGGVKQGTGVTIANDGTLSATGSGGTITGVGAGTGLGGGGTFGAVSLFLRPPSLTTIGGVYAGENVTIAPDGKISIAAQAGVQSVSVIADTGLEISGTVTNPILSGVLSTTASSGVVILSDSISGVVDPTGYAATPLAVKTVADVANAALPIAGGTMTGAINFAAGQAFPGLIPASEYSQVGGILVGFSGGAGYQLLSPGNQGQVLTVDGSLPIGLAWEDAGQGTVTSVSGVAPVSVATGTSTPVISVSAATNAAAGVVQLSDDPTSTDSDTAPSSLALSITNTIANAALPLAGGVLTGNITFAGSQTFPGVLLLSGGTLTGLLTFAAGQTFPDVLSQGSISGNSPLVVGGTISNPILSVDTATTSSLGVVQPDGTTITINGSGVISAVSGGSSLPLSGGTMTGNIVFSGTQTFPGTISSSLLDVTGDIVYASAANTPASLPIGAAGSILAVNAGLPAWRTSTQLGLLTSSSAASTYAPLDSPTFTGPATINTGGVAGSNALTLSGGNLVLSTAFTPPSSSSTGTVGELAWDDSGYLYFCYAPNTWGRVQIDLTPF